MVEVQSFWMGDALSSLEINCIKSHLKVGHTFILWTYEPIEGIPEGVIIKDANLILDKSNLDKGREFGYYPVADIFRFNLLYKKGGIWVDLDMFATRSWKPLDEYDFIFASERTIQKGAYRNRTKDKIATICVLKAPPKSGFYYELCLRVASPKFKINRRDACMIALRNLLDKFNMDKYVVDYHFFCPVDWWNTKELFLDTEFKEKYGVQPLAKKDALEISYGIHFWRHIVMNRFGKLNLLTKFSDRSIYKTLVS